MTVIAFSATIGPVPLNVLLSEEHASDVELTSNPIETGAEVNDHAYVKPKKVKLEVADKNAAVTFNALVEFQEKREPFTLITGFRLYNNMVITSIEATRDAKHSKVLKATVHVREVIIVETGVAEDDGSGKDSKDKSKSKKTSKDKAGDKKTADKTNTGANAGDKAGKTVPAPESKSLAKSAFGWSGGGGGSGNIAGGLGPGGVGGSGPF